MRTIDRAIEFLIVSHKEITLANALPAYLREAGFQELSIDAVIAFERALEKYPAYPDGYRGVFFPCILGISKEYYAQKTGALVGLPCARCEACVRQMRTLKVEKETRECRHAEEEEVKKPPKRRSKSKKERRVRAKRDVVVARFDSYAPSTSAVML